MTKQEFYFNDVSNETLEAFYNKFEEMSEVNGITKTEERMLSDCAHQIYEELQRRGEELRGIFLLLKRDMARTDTAELRLLYDKLQSMTVGVNPIWEDDYTETGDPISDAASVMDCFKWFLEVALKERGHAVR